MERKLIRCPQRDPAVVAMLSVGNGNVKEFRPESEVKGRLQGDRQSARQQVSPRFRAPPVTRELYEDTEASIVSRPFSLPEHGTGRTDPVLFLWEDGQLPAA